MYRLRRFRISERSKVLITPILIVLRIILEPGLFYLFSFKRQQQFPIEFQICFQSLLHATEFLNLFDIYSHKFVNFNITKKFTYFLSIYILVWAIFYQILIKNILEFSAIWPLYILAWAYAIFLLSLLGCFLKELFETEKFSLYLYALFVFMLIIKEVSIYSWWVVYFIIYFLFWLGIWSAIIASAIYVAAQFAKIFFAQFSSTHDFINASKKFIDDWLASDTKGLAKLLNEVFKTLAKTNWLFMGNFEIAIFLKSPLLIELYLDIFAVPLAFLLLIRDGFSHSRYDLYLALNAFAMVFMSEMIYHCLSLFLG